MDIAHLKNSMNYIYSEGLQGLTLITCLWAQQKFCDSKNNNKKKPNKQKKPKHRSNNHYPAFKSQEEAHFAFPMTAADFVVREKQSLGHMPVSKISSW